jgi:hypothetical protein
MLRQGPIPHVLHGVIEYAAGVLLIVAPFLLSFESGAATAISLIFGLVVLAVAASTEGPTGMVASITTPVHVAVDLALACLFVASPFVFAFSGESAPTAFFIGLGVAHLMVTIGTRFDAPA